MDLLRYWLYELLSWFRRNPEKWPYDILIGSHGNERIWRPLWHRLRRQPIPGVRLRIVHKRAARLGKRYLGKRGQIMDHYPGRLIGNVEEWATRLDWALFGKKGRIVDLYSGRPLGKTEERPAWWTFRWLGRRRNVAATGAKTFSALIKALYPDTPLGGAEERPAWWTFRWLGRRRNNPSVVVIDIHNGPPGLKFFQVGEKTTRAAIATGYVLGYRRCVLSSQAFMTLGTNAILLENGASCDEELEQIADELEADLRKLAGMSIAELDELYDTVVPEITFYREHEIMLENPDGTRRRQTWEVLEKLEEIPAQPPFTPLPLPAAIADVLCVDGPFFFGLWGHGTMSPIWPEAGLTAAGKPRQKCFGAAYMEETLPWPSVVDPRYVTWSDLITELNLL